MKNENLLTVDTISQSSQSLLFFWSLLVFLKILLRERESPWHTTYLVWNFSFTSWNSNTIFLSKGIITDLYSKCDKREPSRNKNVKQLFSFKVFIDKVKLIGQRNPK